MEGEFISHYHAKLCEFKVFLGNLAAEHNVKVQFGELLYDYKILDHTFRIHRSEYKRNDGVASFDPDQGSVAQTVVTTTTGNTVIHGNSNTVNHGNGKL